jgi:pimeloyl-ACP methyl ester carboxylesterase
MKTFFRWSLRAAATVLVVACSWLLASTLWQLYAAGRDAKAYPPVGLWAQLGGRRIYVYCTGHGAPTVVFESGLGGPTVLWQQIQPTVAATTRTCSYDRDGVGRSDESGRARTAAGFAADLHNSLRALGEHGPIVLVGHSLGGMLAFNYARAYPDDVAGMVLLDPSHPRQFAPGQEQHNEHQQMLKYFHAAPMAATLGLAREALWAADQLKPLPLPHDVRMEYLALASSPKAMRAMAAEADALFSLSAASADFPSLQGKPLVVLSASRSLDEGFPVAFHEEMARRSSSGIHRIVPNASHGGIVLKPASAKFAIAAILEVVDSVRHRP